jgi:hypothetical protein
MYSYIYIEALPVPAVLNSLMTIVFALPLRAIVR